LWWCWGEELCSGLCGGDDRGWVDGRKGSCEIGRQIPQRGCVLGVGGGGGLCVWERWAGGL